MKKLKHLIRTLCLLTALLLTDGQIVYGQNSNVDSIGSDSIKYELTERQLRRAYKLIAERDSFEKKIKILQEKFSADSVLDVAQYNALVGWYSATTKKGNKKYFIGAAVGILSYSAFAGPILIVPVVAGVTVVTVTYLIVRRL